MHLGGLVLANCVLSYVDSSLPCFTDFSLRAISEYLDEATLIPRNSSVLVRRLPGQPCMRIVTEPIIEQDKYNLDL